VLGWVKHPTRRTDVAAAISCMLVTCSKKSTCFSRTRNEIVTFPESGSREGLITIDSRFKWRATRSLDLKHTTASLLGGEKYFTALLLNEKQELMLTAAGAGLKSLRRGQKTQIPTSQLAREDVVLVLRSSRSYFELSSYFDYT
jgi:hypothetical protein